MRVIFLSDVSGSGHAGEVKEVKNGYARNFLIPQKLAVPATHDQLQRLEIIRKAGEERRLKEEQDLRALAERLAQTPITLKAKVGPTGKFYGAVTPAQIAEELSRLTEREIDRRAVVVPAPIHEPGTYQAEVRFAQGIVATVQVAVEGESG
ncbi:MAG: 50S ribosomal protein L9 [Chloroflexi bacterium]|nr:50S ribosomal protein L9 [Chloroflexota bacterium]